MATFGKVNDGLLNMMGAINLNSDAITIALSNTAPASETPNPTTDGNGIIGNVTQIAYTNYSDDLTVDRVLTSGSVSFSQTGGTVTLDYTADIVITATGTLPAWQYVWHYSDTVTSPVDPIICYWDQGSAINLALNDTATLQYNASGIFTGS